MKVDKLHIRSRFKNLEDVKVDFDEHHLMTIVVGRNGSGKSNVLEALVAIFRNLDLGEAPPFSYELNYQLGEENWVKWYEIKVDADPNRGTLAKQYQISVRDKHSSETSFKSIPFSKVKRDKKTKQAEYLPNFLFAYYSGPSDRLEKYFRRHRDEYYRELLYSKLDIRADIRSLFYAKPLHSQFVLMAFFLSPELQKERAFLQKELGIESLDSIHFVLRRPAWERNKEDRFWGADGVVRDFIELLYPHALAPVKVTRNEETSLTGKNKKNDFIHIFLPSVETLHELAKQLTPSIFFKMLESTVLSEIISEVHIRVKVTYAPEPITFQELSEGEQQLLTVLGLLKFTGGKDSLFLLDEPDTHLNPSWAVKYLKFLREFVPNHETSHLLMVTHHPLAIAELEKQQVQVMWRDSNFRVHAQEPEESPRGMGYGGILTSDMFGLRTTLDNSTERLLRLRRRFTEKLELSSIQAGRLKRIDKAIEGLGFTTAHWDEEYAQYLRMRREVEQESEAINATPEVKRVRMERAKAIVQRMLAAEQEENNK
ncbi:chromosome segregation protein SMC [Thalassolituus oleivorans]|uniref:AAA family ATPase n=1 Tax=Thalassolituus oleivorans TaxID=187493 RepID=UPI000949444B|nr:ATP-binding protein [Thalassolituus oleivorans]APR68210.1 chromosome segregation protein SMC [Thalassolituus oleivorans]|tara:strand:- start:5701 stop:7323 length:1623 start_codon:yes stop_codon:yes gene_type:complete